MTPEEIARQIVETIPYERPGHINAPLLEAMIALVIRQAYERAARAAIRTMERDPTKRAVVAAVNALGAPALPGDDFV